MGSKLFIVVCLLFLVLKNGCSLNGMFPCRTRTHGLTKLFLGSNEIVPWTYDGVIGELSSVLAALDEREKGVNDVGPGMRWERDNESGAWVLMPSSVPFAVVHFIGGAGFGTYPHIAYREFLERVVDRCGGGVAVVAVPYEAGLAHGKLAVASEAIFDDVFARIVEREFWPPTLRILRLGHSLGAKLHVLNVCAYSECHRDGVYQPIYVGLVAFNNFGLKDSVAQAITFLEAVGGSQLGAFKNQIIDFAKMAVAASGFEFDPDPDVTKSVISEIKDKEASLTAFRFVDDELDSTRDLGNLEMAENGVGLRQSESQLEVVELPGDHLASVFINVKAEELATEKAIPDAIAGLIDENGSFSFGSEELLEELVDAVVGWVVPLKKKRGETRRLPLLEPNPAE